MNVARAVVVALGLLLGAAQVGLAYLERGLGEGESQDERVAVATLELRAGVCWLVACAQLWPLPAVSVVLFFVAGRFFLDAAAYYDPLDTARGYDVGWAVASFALAAFSALSWWTKRRKCAG